MAANRGESLREFTETITGVDVGGLSRVLSERIAIEFDLLDGLEGRAREIGVVLIQSDGMSKEGLSVLIEPEFLVQV